MNSVIINLLEKEGYSCFGTLLDGISNNTLGMCFIKEDKIYFYKEDGDEISYEELFEYRKSELVVIEYSRIGKRYVLSNNSISNESLYDWNNKIERCSYVVNIRTKSFTILREFRSFRFPLKIEYLEKRLLVYSSCVQLSNIDDSTILISKSRGDLYSVKDYDGSIEVVDFYCKWNGYYIADSKNYFINDVYVSVQNDILYVPSDSLLWKVPSNGNIWAISNIVNKPKNVRGFYAISAESQVLCRLYEHCISWFNITVSSSMDSLWIHSNNELIQISEYVNNKNEYYCKISIRAKLYEFLNHSIVVLGKHYAVFKHNLGPIYYIYDLNSLYGIYDEYIDPIDETTESIASHSVRITQNNLHGLVSLDKGELIIPIKYDGIESWESDGNVYGIVRIESNNNKTSDENDDKIVFEGLYVNDCILIPPCCKKIERWITDDSEYHFEGNMMCKGYKNAGYIVFTLFNDILGLCYNNEILEMESITEINQLGLEYAVVVKDDSSTLYHLNKKLFTAKCKGYKHFTKDMLLMIGDDNQCGLITYDGEIKLSMGNHDLSYKIYYDGGVNTILIIDKDKNVYDSRDMRPLIPHSSRLIDVLIRYSKSGNNKTLFLVCYEENPKSLVFIDKVGNKLTTTTAIYEPVGEVLIVINIIDIANPTVNDLFAPTADEESLKHDSEKEYEYDVFDINLKRFITNDIYHQGYEIVKNECSKLIIRKKNKIEVQYDNNDEDNSCSTLPDSVGDWSFADAELEDFRDNYDY